ALCQADRQQSRALAECHRQRGGSGTMAGRSAGAGLPAIKCFRLIPPDRLRGSVGCARRRSEDNFAANTIGIFAFALYDEGIGWEIRSNRTGGSDGTTVLGGRLGRRAGGGGASTG